MAEMVEDPAAIVASALAGDPEGHAALHRFLGRARGNRDSQAVNEALDLEALRAAGASRPALELLLQCITRHRLVSAAIGRVLVDADDVDDALQETLVAVSRGIAGFEGRARFTTWLHRVAYNTALLVVTRKARGGTPAETLPEPAARPGAIRRMSSLVATRHAVEQALRRLPSHYREPLVLRELEQRSYEEIAEQLQLPVGTVRSRIARGRQQVADYLRA